MYPDQGPDIGTGGGRRTWFIAAGAMVVIGLLVVGVVVARSEPGDPIKMPDPSVTEQGYAKPDDGLDSIGLPVTLTPAAGLVDGQQVELTASGFPTDSQVGLVQCTSQSITLGQSACDMSTLVYAPVNADGTVSATYTVRQHLYIGGTPVDCGDGNVDPATWVSAQTAAEGQFTCIVGVGSLSNYDISGNSAVSFEGAVFGGPTPSIPIITTTTTQPMPEIPDRPEGLVPRPVWQPDGSITGFVCEDPDGPIEGRTNGTVWSGSDEELRGIVPTTTLAPNG